MFCIKDPDRFQKIAAGAQAIIVSLAVLVGGGWTLYTFNSQLQVANAQAQLRKLNRELEAEPKLEITLDVKQTERIDRRRYVVVGTVSVKNVGSSTTALNIKESPLCIYRVTFDEHGLEQWELVQLVPLRMTDTSTTASLIAHAASTNSKSFAVSLSQPGLYVARLSAARTKKEVDNVQAYNINKDGPTEWGGLNYFTVK